MQNQSRPVFGAARAPKDSPPPRRRLLNWDGLRDKGIHYDHVHLRRMWNSGRFPKPIYLSERVLAWPEEVVDRWIDEKIREAEAAAATEPAKGKASRDKQPVAP